jgi:hypothetical protein
MNVRMSRIAAAALVLAASTTMANAASCTAERGRAEARKLVDQCQQVSPATHPPCNAADPCSMMEDEVSRGCSMLSGNDKPGFCDDY